MRTSSLHEWEQHELDELTTALKRAIEQVHWHRDALHDWLAAHGLLEEQTHGTRVTVTLGAREEVRH